MIQNFFKTAFRSLWKNKSFSLINVLGLTVGIAASLLIFLVIQNELSYDGYHKNKEHIYRLVTQKIKRSNGEVAEKYTAIPHLLPETMRQEFPDLQVAGISRLGGAQVYVPAKDMSQEKRFKENSGLFFIDAEFFEMFDFTWLAGNAKNLTNPNTGVLCESLAKKYFGSAENAIGKTIQFWSFRVPVQIGGVYKDVPSNSDNPVRMGISFVTLHKLNPAAFTDPKAWGWINWMLHCYVQPKKGEPIAQFQPSINGFVKKYYPQDASQESLAQLGFQPLKDVHLNEDYGRFTTNTLSKKELWSLGLIGAFLLLVACINFINLATAQSVTRAKEIGVRKVLGSNRSQLMQQFLQETGVLTLLALVLGYLVALGGLPVLNSLLEKQLSLNPVEHPVILLFLAGLTLIVTFLAGFYPALVLSGFSPAMAFRNKISSKIGGGLSLRRGLVVFQFVIAQLLVIATIVVVKQMQFFRNSSLGMEKEGIAMVNLPSDSTLKLKYPLLKNRLEAINGVVSTSLCMEGPAVDWSWKTKFSFDNNPETQPFEMTGQLADADYFKTFGIKLVAGRLPFQSDTVREVVVNEEAVKRLGFTQPRDIIGKTILLEGYSPKPIIGVVANYSNRSLRTAQEPLFVTSEYRNYEFIAVRMQKENLSASLESIQRIFKDIYPTYMFDMNFFDERFEQFYRTEATTSLLFKIFAGLAIFISCLGLYGLVSFMAVQKTKEVGIRKVLGASVQSIVYLFSREFTVLIIVAFLIAAPAGYYFMNQWLSDYYYHIAMGWSVFVLAIVCSVFVAWIAVGYKAVKAALVNPVKSLKSE